MYCSDAVAGTSAAAARRMSSGVRADAVGTKWVAIASAARCRGEAGDRTWTRALLGRPNWSACGMNEASLAETRISSHCRGLDAGRTAHHRKWAAIGERRPGSPLSSASGSAASTGEQQVGILAVDAPWSVLDGDECMNALDDSVVNGSEGRVSSSWMRCCSATTSLSRPWMCTRNRVS